MAGPMRNPYQQYSQVGQVIETSQRNVEATALLATARDLNLVVDNWDGMNEQLDTALERNKLLWTILAGEVADNANLPDDVKQNILNLAIFVFQRTMSLMGTPSREGVGVLININRSLAQGLSS